MNAARVATLAVGGTLAALALVATALGTAAAVGIPDYSGMQVVIPATATAVEIDAADTYVEVDGGPNTAERPFAQYYGSGTSALGAVPVLVVTMRGTTAVVTIEGEARSLLWGYSTGQLSVELGTTRLDSLKITSGNGWPTNVTDVNAGTLILDGDARVNYDDASMLPEHIDFVGKDAPQVTLDVPRGSSWAIAEPDWWAASHAQECAGSDPGYCTAAGGGPGFYIPSDPEATHAADFTRVGAGAFIRVGDGGND